MTTSIRPMPSKRSRRTFDLVEHLRAHHDMAFTNECHQPPAFACDIDHRARLRTILVAPAEQLRLRSTRQEPPTGRSSSGFAGDLGEHVATKDDRISDFGAGRQGASVKLHRSI